MSCSLSSIPVRLLPVASAKSLSQFAHMLQVNQVFKTQDHRFSIVCLALQMVIMELLGLVCKCAFYGIDAAHNEPHTHATHTAHDARLMPNGAGKAPTKHQLPNKAPALSQSISAVPRHQHPNKASALSQGISARHMWCQRCSSTVVPPVAVLPRRPRQPLHVAGEHQGSGGSIPAEPHAATGAGCVSSGGAPAEGGRPDEPPVPKHAQTPRGSQKPLPWQPSYILSAVFALAALVHLAGRVCIARSA